MDEEIMEALAPEDTTPEGTEAESAAAEQQPVDTTAETDTGEQPEDTTPPEPTAEEEAQPPAPVTVPVKFRHEQRDLTMEEATKYAQMGLLREAEQPMMDQLAMMAAGRGQTVQEFVDSWSRAEERALLEDKLKITGGNREEAEKLLKFDLESRRTACNARQQQEREQEAAAEQSIVDRLATEFAEVQQEYPEMTDYSNLPQEVINDAVRNNRHLLDAYMRYERREAKKINQNQATQAAAAKASAGGLADKPPATEMDVGAASLVHGVESVFA